MYRSVAVALLMLLSALGSRALAQSPNTATVVVIVFDESGAIVAGSTVLFTNTMTGATREATSGDDGSATMPALSLTGVYRVTVKKAGFTDGVLEGVTLRAGETAELKVKLLVSGGRSEVTVYGTAGYGTSAGGVRNDPEPSVRLDKDAIDETPILGRKVTSLPMLDAAFRNGKGTGDLQVNQTYIVSGAGGRRQATFVIDGATDDEPWARQTMFSTVPVGAIQEMTVESRAFSSEFGWTSGAAVNIVTKAGTNAYHGEALYMGRPGGWEKSTYTSAGTTLAPADVPDVLHQFSGALGGPIVGDKTFFFVAGDYTRQDRTAYFSQIPATRALLNGVTSYTGNYRQGLIDARVDQKLNSNHTLMVRVNVDRFYDNNPSDVVSSTTLPSAARLYQHHAWSVQGNETAVLGPSMLNEARFEFLDGDPITSFDAVTPSTRFVRSGVATEGDSRYTHIKSREAQFSDTLSWTKGRHYVRVGGSLAHEGSGGDGSEEGGAYVLGQWTINPAVTVPISQLTVANATQYSETFNFGISNYWTEQWIYDLYAQDRVRLSADLTLDLGLRYDRQTFTDGKKNVAPRVGFTWHPAGDTKTAVHGGYGLYYTMIKANDDGSFQLSGPQGSFTYTAAPGQLGFPSSLTAVPIAFPAGAVLPARNITIRPGMASYYSQFFDISKLPGYASATFDNPRSQVGSIGVERQLASRLFVSADYVTQHWTGLDRSVDLNAPSLFVRTAPGQVRSVAAADATRPITPVNNGFRRISVIENLGVADYNGLQTNVRWQNEVAQVSLSYTLSKATNTYEPDGEGAGPNDFNQLGPAYETGPSLQGQRHRAVLVASYRLPLSSAWPLNLTVGTVNQLASGRPYNATTGVDNNGDGQTYDRPVINGVVVGRNAFTGTPIYDTAIFAEGRIKLQSGRAVVLRLEGFNVFNHANILGYNGVYGNAATPSAAFGIPNTGMANLDPARQFQFSLRFTF
jgi:hypothetical protein